MAVSGYTPRLPVTVHRDQDQKNPLFGALETGCEFIEFDVHLVKGQLLVGHDAGDPTKTMEAIYMDPLAKLSQEGELHGQFSLIVDIKTEAGETFARIQKVLMNYVPMLTSFDGTVLERRHVQVIISGNRDRKAIEAARPRLAFYDGRLSDFKSPIDPMLMPLLSDKYLKVVGKIAFLKSVLRIPPTMHSYVTPMLEAAVEAGIRFRMWAVPDLEGVWDKLRSLEHDGTYVYNTDTPAELAAYLTRSSE